MVTIGIVLVAALSRKVSGARPNDQVGICADDFTSQFTVTVNPPSYDEDQRSRTSPSPYAQILRRLFSIAAGYEFVAHSRAL